MNSPRALANQKLYHARILAESWRRELRAQAIPERVLGQAFEPAARDHLSLAYGWFLLEIVQPGQVPDTPPANTAELPEAAQGLVLPGEIRELQRLEKSGWIGDMLRAQQISSGELTSPGNLASAASGHIDPDQIDDWIGQLQTTFDRMADSLDEY